jgi:poly(3-hydroxybutyrate) depolymerase
MIYEFHELQQAVTMPLRLIAATSQSLFSNPFSPLFYAPGSSHIAAGSELLARVVKRYEKPRWGLDKTEVDGRTVAVTHRVAHRLPFCHLLHFVRSGVPPGQKVLLVAPMSGHHATLLRDTVRMLIRDFDVYVTDWIDPRLVSLAEGVFHFATFVEYIETYLRLLGPDAHVMAVCQPTVPVLAAVSLMAARGEALPRTMVMMGGPIDTRASPTAVNEYAEKHSVRWFDASVITRVPAKYPGFMRRVYPGFLQHSGFVAMNPDRHLQAHLDFYNHLLVGDDDSAAAHRKFYDEYNAVMDLDAAFYLETLQFVFKEHQLPEGAMKIDGEPVRPRLIRDTALMSVEGELDDICAPGQTVAIHELCDGIPAARHRNLLMPGVGHYGIFSGRRWREKIYPQVRDFMHAQARGPKPGAALPVSP